MAAMATRDEGWRPKSSDKMEKMRSGGQLMINHTRESQNSHHMPLLIGGREEMEFSFFKVDIELAGRPRKSLSRPCWRVCVKELLL